MKPGPQSNPSKLSLVSLDATESPSKPLRFIAILKAALEGLEGNRNALKTAIDQANEHARSPLHFSYDKLTKLLNGDSSVGLTVDDLNALSWFLSRFGEGLDEVPLFDKAGILPRLVECKHVSIFFGAYPNVQALRNDVSLWDMRAQDVFLHEVPNLNQPVHIGTQDVLWTNDHAKLSRDVKTTIGQLDRFPCSVISIGTPRACMATEVLLAEAFNVAPRTRPKLGGDWKPPFAFVWPPQLRRNVQSSFAMTGEDLIKLGHSKIGRRVEDGVSSALKVGGEVFETRLKATRSKWTMYGIIVAQRRAKGNVWLVVSGISGPATRACALKASEMTDNLPYAARSNGPVLWAVVKANVSIDNRIRGLGDRRMLDSYELFRGPYEWPGSQSKRTGQRARAQ